MKYYVDDIALTITQPYSSIQKSMQIIKTTINFNEKQI